jgi:RNA polymerase sigma-70 factor (ECF subfamily)
MTKPTNYSDLQLVDLARKGDDKAFGMLVERHWGNCVGIASHVLRDRDEAKDQAQNAILRAYQHLDQLQSQDEAGFGKWLGRIVVNECRMLMRLRHRERRFVFLDAADLAHERVPVQLRSGDDDPERIFACLEFNQLLRSEVKRIPPLLRGVISLRYLQELPRRKVAAALGINETAVKSRLVYARAELRIRLAASSALKGSQSND